MSCSFHINNCTNIVDTNLHDVALENDLFRIVTGSKKEYHYYLALFNSSTYIMANGTWAIDHNDKKVYLLLGC